MAAASASVLPYLAVGSSVPAPTKSETAPRSALCSCSLPSASWRSHHTTLSSRLPNSLAFSPLSARPAGTREEIKIVAMATGESSDPSAVVTDALKGLQEAWDKTEDKLAVGGLGFAALIVLWASTGLIGAIDKLPLIPNFFEVVGILFTGWFVYQYLLFKPDREELVKKIEDNIAKITGSES